MDIPLVTARLVLRRLQLSDCAGILAYRADPQVARFQGWEPRSLEEMHEFVKAQLALQPNMPDTWFQLAITLRPGGELIGDCGLHFPPDGPHQAELGITVAPAYQRQGYAAEALTVVLDYLFLELDKHRAYASVDPDNIASRRLLARLGMRQEAHFRESLWFKGRWADDVIYALLQHEWRAQQSSST